MGRNITILVALSWDREGKRGGGRAKGVGRGDIKREGSEV
jgi:hypothetical protein